MERENSWHSLLKITFITVIIGLLFSCFCLMANIRMQTGQQATHIAAVKTG